MLDLAGFLNPVDTEQSTDASITRPTWAPPGRTQFYNLSSGLCLDGPEQACLAAYTVTNFACQYGLTANQSLHVSDRRTRDQHADHAQ